MLGLIKQVCIVLLSFSSSLGRADKFSDETKCVSLYNKPCLLGATLLMY